MVIGMAKMNGIKNESGFTIIEMLMVILLVAILAGTAIPQFLDFRTEAKDAASKSSLGSLRTGIANQKGNMILRCGAGPGAFPSAASVNANSMVTGGDCTAVQVPNTSEAQLVASPTVPGNPWGPNQAKTVVACTGAGCSHSGTDCAGAAYVAATSDGWCYNPSNGEIWPNSNNSAGPQREYLF